MAIRQEDLLVEGAVVYPFPTHMVRRRAAHRIMMARRRRTLGIAIVVLTAWQLASLPTLG